MYKAKNTQECPVYKEKIPVYKEKMPFSLAPHIVPYWQYNGAHEVKLASS